MVTCEAELDLDFGEVGYWKAKAPFRIRLLSAPLKELIAAASDARRVYELMLINRPGDLWDYVDVQFLALPPPLAERIDKARANSSLRKSRPWAENRMPFRDLDSLLYLADDDTLPEDAAWFGAKEAPSPMPDFARLLLGLVREAQRRTEYGDELVKVELARIQSGQHPYDLLTRPQALERSRDHVDPGPRYPEGFYAKLQELLKNPEIRSIACEGDMDYRVLKLLAAMQLKWANATGKAPRDAYPVCMSSDGWAVTEAWGAEIWYYQEGLGYGDLYIGSHQLRLPATHRKPSKFVLTLADCRDVGTGYKQQTGNGYVLYFREVCDG